MYGGDLFLTIFLKFADEDLGFRSCMWNPTKMTSADGAVFFDGGKVVDQTLHFWIYFLGSSYEAKNFSCTMEVKNKNGEKFTYTGPVHTLDKRYSDIIAEKSCFTLGTDPVKRSRNGEDDVVIEITIRNLEEEPKDEDMESLDSFDDE